MPTAVAPPRARSAARAPLAPRAAHAATGALLALAALAPAERAAAQGTGSAAAIMPAQRADPHPGPGPAITRGDAATLGGALAAAVALMTVDERIARWSQRQAARAPTPVRRTAAVVRVAGDPGTLALGGVTYLVGVAARDRATAEVGLHTAGSIVAAGVVTGAIKMATGRARPYVTGDSNAHSFAPGRGLRRGNAYQSFPSGHATAAFAFAAALSAEGRHRWPTTNRVTEPLAYTAASLVALSRVYHDRHWASDVVLGAGVGFVAGRALVRYQHARPDNAVDRRLLPRRSRGRVPVPATVRWSIAF
jgi:membrane-associated phospholipid phosphatase